MTDRFDPITPRATLTNQLRRKSRVRRDQLERMTLASIAPNPRNDILPRLELSQIPVADLQHSPRKTRKLDPAHAREIASAIRVLGFCAPVLIGHDNELIDGEARLEATRQLGLDRIPCIRIAYLKTAASW